MARELTERNQMAFISVMSAGSGGGGAVGDPEECQLAKHRTGPKEQSKGYHTCAITLGSARMRRMRWVDGDRVQLQFDTETRMIRISRVVNEKGVVLRIRGKTGTARTSCHPQEQAMAAIFPNGKTPFRPKPVTETAEGIIFPYPE